METIHSDARSWDELWKAVTAGPSGGQASSKIGYRLHAPLEPGFIKILTKQDETERRQRFYRETAILESLEIEGIPRLIETNARHFNDKDFQLYAVSTYVHGKTLRELTSDSYSPEEAIQWMLALCNILQACREVGIRHRDIKPENCIIDISGKFHLVDFGLASNVNERDGFHTAVGQEIGNRFLRVPEFRPDSANKDDPRTDLTFTVGLLFFLLTRRNPRVFLDENAQLPHQRQCIAELLKAISVPRPERLMRLFDQGFQLSLDRRFQSAESLKGALLGILEVEASGAKADALQRRILEHAQSPISAQGKMAMDKLHAMRAQIDGLCDRMLEELGGVVGRLGGPIAHADMRQASLSYETGFLYNDNTHIHIMLGFLFEHYGTEIVLSVYSNRVVQISIRTPATVAQLTAEDLEKIREAYLAKLASLVDGI